VKGARRLSGRLAIPDEFDELIHGHRPARLDQQDSQHGALAQPLEI
jgi:hypothetical protein